MLHLPTHPPTHPLIQEAPHGGFIAASQDKMIRVYDMEVSTPLSHPPTHPPNQGLQQLILTAFSSSTHPTQGTRLRLLIGHEHGVISLSWSAGGQLISGSWDGTAKVKKKTYSSTHPPTHL